MKAVAEKARVIDFDERGNVITSVVKTVSNTSGNAEVLVDITRNGDFTIAVAELTVPWGQKHDKNVYVATGATVKSEIDKENVSIGDNLAIARALKKLASILCQDTMDEVHERSRGRNLRPFGSMNDEQLDEILLQLDDEYLLRCKKLEKAELAKAEAKGTKKKKVKEKNVRTATA